LPAEFVNELTLAAPLHDVGKIGVPDYVLRKPDRLDAQEFAIMQQHTVIGHRILADSQSPLLVLGAEIALTHHEKFDGTGYPNGLAGDKIPLCGRIVAVADVFDALTSRRPYQTPWGPVEAKSHIVSRSGSQFDPRVVEAFVNVWDAVLETFTRLADDAQRTAPEPIELAAV
jgi:putative two-component system response regulator